MWRGGANWPSLNIQEVYTNCQKAKPRKRKGDKNNTHPQQEPKKSINLIKDKRIIIHKQSHSWHTMQRGINCGSQIHGWHAV